MASEQTSTTTSVQGSQPAEKKPEGGRKQRTCVSVIKGEACRTQMEGKVCPYNHEGAPAAETLTRVYVCHLPLTFTNDDIQKLASPHGKIQESRILVDPRTNMSRGVAFIHYERHEDAENAIKALNESKLPGHATALAARYARRTRPGRRLRRRSRSRSPPRRLRRRSRSRSPPRRRRPGRRKGYRSYDDEFDDYDYDAYYPRRRPNYPPYEDDYDPVGPDRGYAPYGGRSGTGYTTYTPPTAGGGNNPVGSAQGQGLYSAPPSSYANTDFSAGYGSQQGNNGRVDGYRSFPQSGQYNQSTDYGVQRY